MAFGVMRLERLIGEINDEMYQKISDTLTILATGGERDE